MNVSMVSLSRLAGSPHLGHFTFMNSGTFSSGDRPLPPIGTFSGSTTGRSLSGTGTMPHFGQ